MSKQEYEEFQKQVGSFLRAYKVSGPIGPEDAEDEGYFSWDPCDVCRRPLGGLRREYLIPCEPVPGALKVTNYVAADICQECEYYLTYGRLDDATMASMEDVPA